jgi:hypothetical protein
VRHFFPEFNQWLDGLPDRRDQDAIIYERRFLAWWGILLYVLQLGSRRQLDFELESAQVVANVNHLANTQQSTRPVHDTLDYFLGKSRASAVAGVLTKIIRRLLRMKVLEEARLQGAMVMAVDGTGWLCFRERHCDHCLVRRYPHGTIYFHRVLDATTTKGTAAAFKQDCELSAFSRLAAEVKQAYPQLRLCLAGDALYACGRVFQIAQDNHWSYVLTLKEGQMPAVWREFQNLLPLCPENSRDETLWRGPQTVQQHYRWVHGLSYQDEQKRTWTFDAIQCQETVAGETTTFAWVTPWSVTAQNVVTIATQGGRARWQIENQGFNRQKNSGLNLEHVYSLDPEKAKAYYYLLQIAHILLQLLEHGKFLRQLAAEFGKTPVQWFGSLQNIGRRLLDSIRHCLWPDPQVAPTIAADSAPVLDTS